MFGSGNPQRDQGRTSATGGNGNVRDSDEAVAGAKHAAATGRYSAAVNDLRNGSSTAGKHRAE